MSEGRGMKITDTMSEGRGMQITDTMSEGKMNWRIQRFGYFRKQRGREMMLRDSEKDLCANLKKLLVVKDWTSVNNPCLWGLHKQGILKHEI